MIGSGSDGSIALFPHLPYNPAPETAVIANRTLEEMDLLFASKSPFVWDEEKTFRRLKAEMQASGKGIQDVVESPEVVETEKS